VVSVKTRDPTSGAEIVRAVNSVSVPFINVLLHLQLLILICMKLICFRDL